MGRNGPLIAQLPGREGSAADILGLGSLDPGYARFLLARTREQPVRSDLNAHRQYDQRRVMAVQPTLQRKRCTAMEQG